MFRGDLVGGRRARRPPSNAGLDWYNEDGLGPQYYLFEILPTSCVC